MFSAYYPFCGVGYQVLWPWSSPPWCYWWQSYYWKCWSHQEVCVWTWNKQRLLKPLFFFLFSASLSLTYDVCVNFVLGIMWPSSVPPSLQVCFVRSFEIEYFYQVLIFFLLLLFFFACRWRPCHGIWLEADVEKSKWDHQEYSEWWEVHTPTNWSFYAALHCGFYCHRNCI